MWCGGGEEEKPCRCRRSKEGRGGDLGHGENQGGRLIGERRWRVWVRRWGGEGREKVRELKVLWEVEETERRERGEVVLGRRGRRERSLRGGRGGGEERGEVSVAR